LFLWHPAEVVFDEVHFGKFVSYYFSGEYFFDIHPPLGKLLIAGFAKLLGFAGGFSFAAIGDSYGAENLFILRFLPALFGALFIPLVYKFTLSLSGSRRAALAAGFLVLLDNAFLVESKFILVDSMLFFFGILALWLFALSQQKREFTSSWLILFSLSGLAAGATFSIKWTGLAPFALILSLMFLEIFRRKKFFSSLKTFPNISCRLGWFLIKAGLLILTAGFIYTVGFYIHFWLLNKSGTGNAFMSPNFQKTLQGSEYQNDDLPVPNFWQKFSELNKTMYTANAGLLATHPFSSRWYEWPLGRRPIYYWNSRKNALSGGVADIWLTGNPFSWWLAGLTVGLAALAFVFKSVRRKFNETTFFLLFAYFANLLPFVFINRVAFLYHYLPALTFAFIILAIKINDILKQRKSRAVFFGLAALFFLILAPVSYGIFLPVPLLDLSRVMVQFLAL
jgi:dolichyl-phosphate-mannose-protein mannosyltransferase